MSKLRVRDLRALATNVERKARSDAYPCGMVREAAAHLLRASRRFKRIDAETRARIQTAKRTVKNSCPSSRSFKSLDRY